MKLGFFLGVACAALYTSSAFLLSPAAPRDDQSQGNKLKHLVRRDVRNRRSVPGLGPNIVCQQTVTGCGKCDCNETRLMEFINAELTNMKTAVEGHFTEKLHTVGASLSNDHQKIKEKLKDITRPEEYPEWKVKVFDVDGPDIEDARAECKKQNGSLATHEQVKVAFKFGLHDCRCGWLEAPEGSIPLSYYAMQWPEPGCGEVEHGQPARPAQLKVCGSTDTPRVELPKGAYCFME